MSLSQIHPSALIEPFFGDSEEDARLGEENKARLAQAIIIAFLNEFGTAETSPELHQPLEPQTAAIPASPLFRELAEKYAEATIEYPSLGTITLAQWAQESGWARSNLAKQHFNFAGMKWRDQMAPYATKIWYEAHDGGDYYCRFNTLEDFIAGYWHRLNALPAYHGWLNHTASPKDFISFIGGIWVGGDDRHQRNYVLKIVDLASQIDQRYETFAGAANTDNPPLEDGAFMIPDNAAPIFRDLFRLSQDNPEQHPALRHACLAHWALESAWGRSELAKCHYNFAGMQWSALMADHAAKVHYNASTGPADYCRFLDIDTFIKGYWHFIQSNTLFDGWQTHTENDELFIRFLAPRWRPNDHHYSHKLEGVIKRAIRSYK